MDVTNTLQRIADSKFRIASLETQETDRMLALFKRYSLTTGKAVYDWTAQSGLYRVGVEHIFIPRTRTPMDVIAYIGASRHYGIYLLREFESELVKPSIQKSLGRLCDIDDGVRRLVLLVGEIAYIPAALRGRIATVRHHVRERQSAAPQPSVTSTSMSRRVLGARRNQVTDARVPRLVTSISRDDPH